MRYAISLFFESLHDGNASGLCEEQILLVEASGPDEAMKIGEKLAIDKESSYKNEAGETVSWRFFAIESVYEIDDDPIENGTELFSRHMTKQEVVSLLKQLP